MRKLSSLAYVLTLLVGAGAASAASINVAILSTLGNSSFDTDVVSKIAPNAPFLNITVIDVDTSTPALGILEQYSALMVIGSQAFQDAITLGNNLKQYIDDGHSVVVTALTNTSYSCSSPASYQLCGGFQTSDYWAIDPALIKNNQHSWLGTEYLPNSPLLAGVSAGAAGFDGGTQSYRIPGTVHGTRVADWSDGTPFLVTRNFGSGANEVDVNFLPVSSDQSTGLWLSSTQGGLILANAFDYAAGVPEPGGENATMR